MSVVMDIYGLIRDLMTEAEKVKDDKLYSSLIDIKKGLYGFLFFKLDQHW